MRSWRASARRRRISSRSPFSRMRSSAFRAGARPSCGWWTTSTRSSTRRRRYIVQILGGMGDASVQTARDQLTARLAKLTGGEPRLLLVQGITSSREAKLVMLADPVVRETMDLFGRLSLAIIGIGAVEPSELLGPLRQRLLAPGNGDAARSGRGRRDFVPLLRQGRKAGRNAAERARDRHIPGRSYAKPTASWRWQAENRKPRPSLAR